MRLCGVRQELQQRLDLYGFAVLQVDPFQPEQLQQLGLSFSLAPVVSSAWRGYVQGLRFSKGMQTPLLATSLKVLEKQRQAEPDRPLVLLQTAFEPCPKRVSLAKAQPFLDVADVTRPVLCVPEPRCPVMRVLPYQSQHPREKLRQFFEKSSPDHQFFLQADGSFQEQLSFGGKVFAVPGHLRREINHWDAEFKSQELPKRAYVFAGDPQKLAWFQRDVIRHFGNQWFFHFNPVDIHPEDPSSHLICLKDSQIKFTRLHHDWPVIHLDQNPQKLFYRAWRISASGAHWPMGECLAQARLRRHGQVYHFRRESRGWFCGQGVGPDETAFLARRAKAHLALCS